MRRDAAGAQRPQPILGEARGGVSDGADQLAPQVAAAVERIDDTPARHLHGDTVDGEVAPAQIVLDGGAERDLRRAPPVAVVGLAAEGGDFDPVAGERHRYRPVPQAGGNGLPVQRAHLLGMGVGSHVVIAAGAAQEQIAHRAAHQPALQTAGGERAREAFHDLRNHRHGSRSVGRL